MAVTAKLYGKAQLALANKEIDWTADTIMCALCTSSYTPDQDAHDYFNDITNEVSGSGYTSSGCTLTNTSGSYIAATNITKFDADDVLWLNATLTARYAILYDATSGSAASNPLIGYVDFGADVTATAGTFTLTWASDGCFSITTA
jgi:hypothetical protein